MRDRRRPSPPQNKSHPLAQKVVELEQKLAAVTQAKELPVDLTLPFTPKIDRVQGIKYKKMPPMESYNGTGDPYDHTHAYDHLMRYYNHPNAAKC